MEPTDNTPDPYDYNPADAGTDRPEAQRPEREEAQPARGASAPTPIHGIAGILAMIPRDVPDGMWATIRLPETDADHATMSEVGVVIRRETIAESLERCRIKMCASDIDAIVAATGYALSAMTAHLIVGAVAFADSQREMPAEVRRSFAETASRMASVDNHLAPIFRLIDALATEGNTPEDKRASRTRNEIMAGSTVMGSLVRHDGHLIAVGSAIALAATNALARELGGRLEGGHDGSSE